MVNYCCVKGCSKNSRDYNHLIFYSLPKDNRRTEIWLTAIKREELLKTREKSMGSMRICSMHFPPDKIFKKKLAPDAVPILHLSEHTSTANVSIPEIYCDACNFKVKDSHYTCIECRDFTICQHCEGSSVHSQHYMLRISVPLANKNHSTLKRHIRKFYNQNNWNKVSMDNNIDFSSDDEPIIKYSNTDDVLDLNDTEKAIIKREVARALKHGKKHEVSKEITNDETFTKISIVADGFKSENDTQNDNCGSDQHEVDIESGDEVDNETDDENLESGDDEDEVINEEAVESECDDDRPKEMEFANVDNDEVKIEMHSAPKDDMVDKLKDDLSEFLLTNTSGNTS